jgi:hypothetical protein
MNYLHVVQDFVSIPVSPAGGKDQVNRLYDMPESNVGEVTVTMTS